MGPLAGLAIQAAPALIGLFGNMLDKKRRQSQEGKAAGGFSQLTDVLKGQLGQSYLGSTEGMGLMKEIDQNADSQMDQVMATANMSGMTDEAKIAMMGKVMAGKQNAYAGLARNSDIFRQRNLQNYQGALSSLFQAGMANRQMQQNSLNNITQGLGGAIGGMTNAGVFDNMFDSWTNKG
jgi:hypothetical protein